jgi:hypothetical protein
VNEGGEVMKLTTIVTLEGIALCVIAACVVWALIHGWG